MKELLRLQWDNRERGGSTLLQYAFHTPATLIGIGGPVHLFLPAATKALNAECIIPPCAAVANAVGAVTGQMSCTAMAEIRPHGLSLEEDDPGDYEVLCDGQPTTYFASEEDAVEWVSHRLRIVTERKLRAQGAVGELSFQTTRNDIVSPAYAGSIKLATCVSVTAGTSLMDSTSGTE